MELESGSDWQGSSLECFEFTSCKSLKEDSTNQGYAIVNEKPRMKDVIIVILHWMHDWCFLYLVLLNFKFWVSNLLRSVLSLAYLHPPFTIGIAEAWRTRCWDLNFQQIALTFAACLSSPMFTPSCSHFITVIRVPFFQRHLRFMDCPWPEGCSVTFGGS